MTELLVHFPRMPARPIFFLLLLAIPGMYTHLAAQTGGGSVRGTILDDSTRNPLQFVNVLLLKSSDSTLVAGASTGPSGKFELPNLSWGSYFVTMGLVGYLEKKTDVFQLDAQHKRLNLGTISLQSEAVRLDEVTVTADKPKMENLIDRLVYNVDQDVMSRARSASDILQDIPSVQIDLNGEVLLRGSSRVLMMINGKKSPLLEKQEGIFLEQLPASSIERIEVITTPSARYSAEGKSGIINIVLKKDTPLGTHGTIAAHLGNVGRYNGSTRLNYSPGSFNVYGSYSIRRDNHNRLNSDDRSIASTDPAFPGNSTYTDDLFSDFHPETQFVTAGLDCHIDSLNSLGISGSYFQNRFTRLDSSYRTLQNVQDIVISQYYRTGSGDESDIERTVSANFHHNFSRRDNKLKLEFTTSASPHHDNYTFANIYTSPPFPSAFDNSQINQEDTKTQIAAEYSNVLKGTSTSLEAGYTGEFTRTALDFYHENFDPLSGTFLVDTSKTSSYRYTESVHSLYVTFRHAFGPFGFLGGLRAEAERRRSDLVTADSAVVNTFFQFFPSVHLSYTFSPLAEMKLSYSRRVTRPKPRDLNPFPEYRDPKNVSYGNPLLLPEYLHSLELACQLQGEHMFLQPSVFYRRSTNALSSLKDLVNRSTLQTTKNNVASDESAGLETIVSWTPGSFYTLNASATGFYEQMDTATVGASQFKSTVSWSGTFTSTFNLTGQSRLEIHSHFNSRRLTPQGEYSPSAAVNVGFRQEFLDGRLLLTATASDIFKTLQKHYELDIPRLRQTVVTSRESRGMYIGFTLRLGSIPKKSREEQFHYDDED